MMLEIDGAGSYRLITRRTIECDVVLSNLLRSTGAEKALVDAVAAGEDIDKRIFEAVTGSGKMFDILGAALMPAELDSLNWSPEIQRETAAKLKRVTSEEGKRTLLLAIVPLVSGFFLQGLRYTATSPNSSPELEKTKLQPDGASEAITTSATGGSWFTSWRRTIRAARWRFPGGR